MIGPSTVIGNINAILQIRAMKVAEHLQTYQKMPGPPSGANVWRSVVCRKDAG